MKIKQVYIDEYGHLKQMSYSFASEDLVVLFGLNEAGKSTLFHFIETVLFGFSRKKVEIEHYSPISIAQYGGFIIIELTSEITIKVTRYLKQHKGQPLVAKLVNEGEHYTIIEEQLLTQDEFERLYLTGLNRTIFRDLCALTLDELQATHMQDDEQLNQHLYHATWENSKLIAQLEKKSQDIITGLYRPRGTRQSINIILSELKHIKNQLNVMENELDAYESIQQRLLQIELEEQQLILQAEQLEQNYAVLSKAELDYPLYTKYCELQFKQQQIASQLLEDKQLLDEITSYMIEREQKQPYIADIKQRRQQLLLELDSHQPKLNPEQYEALSQIIEQYNYIEPLLDDIEARREQYKKQMHFVKQKCTLGSSYINEEQVLIQQWSQEDIELLTKLEEEEKQLTQRLHLLKLKQEEYEEKSSYLEEQLKWPKQSVEVEEQAPFSYTFIPQQLDDVIRLEAGYEEVYKRFGDQNNQQAIQTPRARSTKAKQAPMLPIIITFIFAFIFNAVLLLTQFNLLNIVLAMIVLLGCVLFAYTTMKRRQEYSISSNSSVDSRLQNDFFTILAQLIAIPQHISSIHDWTKSCDSELRHQLQLFKLMLKQRQQRAEAYHAIEKERFDISYQLNKVSKDLMGITDALQTIKEDWNSFLLRKQLPQWSGFVEVKQFVLELDAIKDNIATQSLMHERLLKDEQKIAEFNISIANIAELMQLPFTDQTHYIIDKVQEELNQQEQTMTRIQQLQLQIEQLSIQLSDLESPLFERETWIRQSYHLAESSSVERWKLWIDLEQQYIELSERLFQLELERKGILSSSQLTHLSAYYLEHSLDDINEAANLTKLEIDSLKQRRQHILEQRGQLQERLNNLSSTTERQQLEQQQLILEEQLEEALQQYTKYAVMHHLVSSTREQFEAEHQPALLQQASLYINQLTNGKYVKIVLHPENHTFELATSALSMVAIERLSRGTAELVYFCLRVALLTTHQSLKNAPLILDDPFVNFDEPRQKLVLSFIHQIAKQRQVLLLTCHKHIVEVTAQQGQLYKVEV